MESIPICVPPWEWLEVDVPPDLLPQDVQDLRDRRWTQAETAAVLCLYGSGCSIYDLEAKSGIEFRDVVVRLIRLMFGDTKDQA